MDSLQFGRLRTINVLRSNHVFHDLCAWTPSEWATALAGEVGEVCNVVKKLRRLETSHVKKDFGIDEGALLLALADELADVVIYADLLAARLSIDLETAVVRKFNFVSVREGSSYLLP